MAKRAVRITGSRIQPFCLGVFVTALYTFRMFFLVFHGEERMDAETKSHLRETPWVVTVPLILLAIPSAMIGWYTVEPVLFGGYFGDAIEVTQRHDVLARLGETGTAARGSLRMPSRRRYSGWRRPVFSRPGSCT